MIYLSKSNYIVFLKLNIYIRKVNVKINQSTPNAMQLLSLVPCNINEIDTHITVLTLPISARTIFRKWEKYNAFTYIITYKYRMILM